MANLVNLSRAAWKRQPNGLITYDPASPQAKGLCAYFPLNGNAYEHVNRVYASPMNGAGFATTQYGLASTLDGSNDYFDVPSISLPLTTNFSISFWALMASNPATTRQFIFGSNDSAGAVQVEIGFCNSAYASSVALQVSGSFKLRSTSSVVIQNTFQHFTIIFASTPALYVDGVSVDVTLFSGTPFTSVIGARGIGRRSSGVPLYFNGKIFDLRFYNKILSQQEAVDVYQNPWGLFSRKPSCFYLIPSSGATTQTTAVSIDALIQRAGLTQSTSIDALLQSAFSRSLSLDSLIAAVQAKTISLDALLQIVGTRTVSVDALVQAVKSGTVSVDALVQMTMAQSLSLDALIVAASASSASTDFDALIQSLKTAGISLDALLSQSKTATAVVDALIQASKTGTVSLDAIITGASSTTVFVGLDALIQAIQAKTISLDALLQKSYTSPLALDAYVALTQVKTMSLDALLQSTKSGVISLDAILQMTKTAMVSFDALIQAAKTGVISMDAILVFATQASILLDAYVQKTLARGVGLDAIIGSIADMILPTGRVITVPASDRFVFVTHSDRVIQIQ